MSNFINTIVAVSLACSLTFVASAEDRSEIIVNEQGFRTVVVTYDDLNLATAAGQEALSGRVRAAVRKVCGATNARPSILEMQDYRSCTSKATQNALASLDKDARARLAANF